MVTLRISDAGGNGQVQHEYILPETGLFDLCGFISSSGGVTHHLHIPLLHEIGYYCLRSEIHMLSVERKRVIPAGRRRR